MELLTLFKENKKYILEKTIDGDDLIEMYYGTVTILYVIKLYVSIVMNIYLKKKNNLL